jgi:nucleoside-diphosphate-sugar epimerase
MAKVLVTGGSGFIGGHVIVQLLAAGHEVRTTVRNRAREADVRAILEVAGAKLGPRLSFAVAALEKDDGWAAACDGIEYVHHLAAPFPAKAPKHEDDLIVPMRDGTLRLLRAARAAGVRRVVVTSSFAAIAYGHPEQTAPFDETTWTDLDGRGITAAVKAKTLAERAAWDYVAKEPIELAVVLPTTAFGPLLGPHISTSVVIVQRMLDGKVPGCPNIMLGVVDVRDVADLHMRAMTSPAAKGERFIATAGEFVHLVDIAQMLKSRLGAAAKKVTTRKLPSLAVRVAAPLDAEARLIVPELDWRKNATNNKARRLLGWAPRSTEDAIIASAKSLLKLRTY